MPFQNDIVKFKVTRSELLAESREGRARASEGWQREGGEGESRESGGGESARAANEARRSLTFRAGGCKLHRQFETSRVDTTPVAFREDLILCRAWGTEAS
jgi:hypothetical protein